MLNNILNVTPSFKWLNADYEYYEMLDGTMDGETINHTPKNAIIKAVETDNINDAPPFGHIVITNDGAGKTNSSFCKIESMSSANINVSYSCDTLHSIPILDVFKILKVVTRDNV